MWSGQILLPVLEIKSKNQKEKHTVVVGHIKNAYRVLVRNMKGKITWETRVDGKVILKLIIKAEDLRCRKNSGTARGEILFKTLVCHSVSPEEFCSVKCCNGALILGYSGGHTPSQQ